MISPLKQISRNIRDYGLITTITKVADGIVKPIYYRRTYLLYKVDLLNIDIPKIDEAGLQIRYIDHSEHTIISQIIEMEEWLEKRIYEILDGNGKCLVALDGNKVAGFNLVSFNKIHLPVVHYEFQLGPEEAFSEQITVNIDYRGKGIGSKLRYSLYTNLIAEGKRVLLGGTDIHNKANLALCRKVGLKVIAKITYHKWLNFKKTTSAPFEI